MCSAELGACIESATPCHCGTIQEVACSLGAAVSMLSLLTCLQEQNPAQVRTRQTNATASRSEDCSSKNPP